MIVFRPGKSDLDVGERLKHQTFTKHVQRVDAGDVIGMKVYGYGATGSGDGIDIGLGSRRAKQDIARRSGGSGTSFNGAALVVSMPASVVRESVTNYIVLVHVVGSRRNGRAVRRAHRWRCACRNHRASRRSA